MVVAKNSRLRPGSRVAASAITRGTTMPAPMAAVRVRDGDMASSWPMPVHAT
jgi:hypothetical protein